MTDIQHRHGGATVCFGQFLARLLLLVVLLTPALVLMTRANHDCSGPGCPVCACLAHAQQVIQQTGSGILSAPPLTTPPLFILFPAAALFFMLVPVDTPVSLKTRIND